MGNVIPFKGPGSLTQLQILLLEDSAADAAMIESCLDLYGLNFTIKRVATREDFTNELRRSKPNVILSDFRLPDINGVEALEIAQRIYRDVPFIMVTGTQREETAFKWIEAGVTDYILKDRLYRLGAAVCSAVEKRVIEEEKKKTEECLRSSEEKFKAVVESANDAVLTMDVSGYVSYANPATHCIFGYSPNELIGKPVRILVPQRNLAKHLCDLDRLRTTGTSTLLGKTVELTGLRKSGEEFPLELSLSSWELNGEKHFAGIVRDISLRKEVEKAREKTLEVEKQNRDLEEFATIASHDLKEPLRTVTMYSQLLERLYKDKLGEDGGELIRVVVEYSKRMGKLIDDLLAFSQLGQKGIVPAETVNLNLAISRAIQNLSMIILETGAEIAIPQLPDVQGNPSLLTMVFQNLLGNAIKFRGNRKPMVEICIEDKASEWIFSVKDNGIGFDPQRQDDLFVIFKKVHDGSFGGSGIGLATCKRIIEGHHGRIWAESSPGQGATFYFSLPQHRP